MMNAKREKKQHILFARVFVLRQLVRADFLKFNPFRVREWRRRRYSCASERSRNRINNRRPFSGLNNLLIANILRQLESRFRQAASRFLEWQNWRCMQIDAVLSIGIFSYHSDGPLRTARSLNQLEPKMTWRIYVTRNFRSNIAFWFVVVIFESTVIIRLHRLRTVLGRQSKLILIHFRFRSIEEIPIHAQLITLNGPLTTSDNPADVWRLCVRSNGFGVFTFLSRPKCVASLCGSNRNRHKLRTIQSVRSERGIDGFKPLRCGENLPLLPAACFRLLFLLLVIVLLTRNHFQFAQSPVQCAVNDVLIEQS